MYLPTVFRETDPGVIFDFVERHSFGLLTTIYHDAPFTSHLPMLLGRTEGPEGTLVGHWARTNPQAIDADGQEGLAVFVGPHAYVSPSWYAEPNVVPTWNYATVHAYGRLETFDDSEQLLDVVSRSVATYEARLPQPWRLDVDAPLVRKLLGQIVGFRLVVQRWEAKFKLNQNHPQARRERVVAALLERGDPESAAVARLMQERTESGTAPRTDGTDGRNHR